MKHKISEVYVVMYEDDSYYGSFSPLGVWEYFMDAEKAAKEWKKNHPNKSACVEKVNYHGRI